MYVSVGHDDRKLWIWELSDEELASCAFSRWVDVIL